MKMWSVSSGTDIIHCVFLLSGTTFEFSEPSLLEDFVATISEKFVLLDVNYREKRLYMIFLCCKNKI